MSAFVGFLRARSGSASLLPGAALSLLMAVALASILLTAGCSQKNVTPTAVAVAPSATPTGTPVASPSKSPAPSDATQQYSIDVYLNDKLVAVVTKDQMLQLDQITLKVPAAGKDQKGPTVLSVLAAAGVTDFSQVTVFGMAKGRVATAQITLKKDQLNDNVILDLTNAGKSKLADTDIPFNNWIIDIDRLAAE